MSYGSFGKNSGERSLESARIVYAAGVCAVASLPLVLSVALVVMWGA
jgi:hypothetical protein